MTDKYIQQVALHYKPGTLTAILPILEAEWKKAAPDRPFRFTTIEDLTKNVYSSERNLRVIVLIFSLFTLLIAAFGLFGLTLFVARSRIREIGIRKVFGSSVYYLFISEEQPDPGNCFCPAFHSRDTLFNDKVVKQFCIKSKY